jgi:hypothetical protein
MNKGLLMALVLLLSCCLSSQAQKTTKGKKRATTRKVTKKKPAIVENIVDISESPLLNAEGGKSLYMGQTGDKLVYEVNAGGKVYDFIITLLPKTDKFRYVFDWEMTAPINRKGHVNITNEAAYDSKKYINYFSGGDLTLTDACSVWLSGQNFGEMPDKQSTLQLDGGAEETFYRKDEAETEYTVLYKGNEVKLDIFKIDNDKAGADHHQIWVQGISSSALIVKMDLGWTIRLKEIR